ncbi:MAG: hypothetical protein ACE5M4_11825, partial [Anaerolineales bacterium]
DPWSLFQIPTKGPRNERRLRFLDSFHSPRNARQYQATEDNRQIPRRYYDGQEERRGRCGKTCLRARMLAGKTYWICYAVAASDSMPLLGSPSVPWETPPLAYRR